MWDEVFDVIVVGAGHAGCEAALAAARMGCKTALFTVNVDRIAEMSCNPAIGGVAKGTVVREIDALGGEMAKNIDETGIQFRILNRKKGPAVRAPRAQADKEAYRKRMRQVIENTDNLEVIQQIVDDIVVENGKVKGVVTHLGARYGAKAVVVTAGTFLRGKIFIGFQEFEGGRMWEPEAFYLFQIYLFSQVRGRLETGELRRNRCQLVSASEVPTFSPVYKVVFCGYSVGCLRRFFLEHQTAYSVVGADQEVVFRCNDNGNCRRVGIYKAEEDSS